SASAAVPQPSRGRTAARALRSQGDVLADRTAGRADDRATARRGAGWAAGQGHGRVIPRTADSAADVDGHGTRGPGDEKANRQRGAGYDGEKRGAHGEDGVER